MTNIKDRIREVFKSVHYVNATNSVHAIATYDDYNVAVYIPQFPKEMKLTGMELIGAAKKIKKIRQKAEANFEDQERSLRRAKKKVGGYIRCNTFELYITFTFRDDRHDLPKCKAKMENWLDNEKKRRGSFEYVIVAELHQDGALHFHALFKDYSGKVVPAKHPRTKKHLTKNGRKVYDLPSYTLGHVFANKISDTSQSRQRLVNYLSKYFTKDMPLFAGKKRYWVSTNLNKPTKEYNPDDWYSNLEPVWSNENEWGKTLLFTREQVDSAKSNLKKQPNMALPAEELKAWLDYFTLLQEIADEVGLNNEH